MSVVVPAIFAARLGLIVLAIVFGVALLSVFKRYRWWSMVAILVVPVVLLPVVLVGVWVSSSAGSHESADAAQVADVEAVDTNVRSAPRPPEAPAVAAKPVTAEVVSDAELEAIASAPPRIELGDDESGVAAPLGVAHAAPAIAAIEPLSKDAATITSDPYTSDARARLQARGMAATWVATRLLSPHDVNGLVDQPLAGPLRSVVENHLDRFVDSESLESRETSVGEVHIGTVVIRIDADDEAWLDEQAKRLSVERRRQTGVRAVVWSGGGVLACVALLHGALRIGGRSRDSAASREA